MRRLLLGALVSALVGVGLAVEVGSMRVTLRYRDVRAVADRVAEELGPQGALRVDPVANVLTVNDAPTRLEAVRVLLQSLDVPPRHFALQAEFGLFGQAPGPGILRGGDPFTDATAWLEQGRTVRSTSVVLGVEEGGTAEAALLPGYTLRVALEGYDPTRRRLGFSDLRVERLRDGRDLLRGRAALPDGEATVFLLAPEGDPDRFRLALTPTLLPSVEHREVP